MMKCQRNEVNLPTVKAVRQQCFVSRNPTISSVLWFKAMGIVVVPQLCMYPCVCKAYLYAYSTFDIPLPLLQLCRFHHLTWLQFRFLPPHFLNQIMISKEKQKHSHFCLWVWCRLHRTAVMADTSCEYTEVQEVSILRFSVKQLVFLKLSFSIFFIT